jgi:hypothetical protein
MRSLVLVASLAACSDSGGGPDAAYDTARCLIKGNYGDLGAITGSQGQGPTTSTTVLEAGPPRDSLFLKLTANKGAFSAGLKTGTFPIAGSDADYNGCGLCLNIIADIVTGQGPAKFYFADSGSVTLTATMPPAGSLSDVHLREVNFMTGVFVPGGCEATIDKATFSTN